jgi:serine/threonine protein kinase
MSNHFTGMEYLHTSGIVHGDLRGVRKLKILLEGMLTDVCQANVLISKRGKACLSDFGFSKVLEEVCNGLRSLGIKMIESYHTTVWSWNELCCRSEQLTMERP